MLDLTGELINTYTSPAGQNKKGEDYEARDKIQIIGDIELPNGETRKELISLTVEDATIYEKFKASVIRVPVGVIATGARSITYFVRKGALPEPV